MKKYNFILLASAAAIITACTPTVNKRGNMVEDYRLKQVVTGVHTRTDVLKIMGSPTTQSPFDENLWYYIGQETEKHGIFDPEVVEERIVAVSFDKKGIVKTVQEVNSDRINIPIERKRTPTHGNDLTVMQQLLGNLGKFNNAAGNQ